MVNVKSWMIANKLQMNDVKTEFMIIGSRQQLKKINFESINVNGVCVKAVDNVKNLGAYLDSTMSMEKHIDMKCRAAFIHLHNIRKIRKYLTIDATKTLLHAFVFSHLDYCNGLLFGLPFYHIKKFQRIQNMAAKLVFRKSKFDHVTNLLIELHWLPVEYRILFKILLFTFKGIQNIGPKYINDMFSIRRSSYSFRTLDSITLEYHTTKRATFEDRALPIAGAKEWNKLPAILRDINDVTTFKKNLKTYLFKAAFDL